MASIELEITTPEKLVFKGSVDEVVAPGAAGLLGVRSGHAPLLSSVNPGILTIIRQGRPTYFVLGGGFLEVSDNCIRILADSADKEDEINLERAKAALEDSARALKSLQSGTAEYQHHARRHKRAQLRIEVATALARR